MNVDDINGMTHNISYIRKTYITTCGWNSIYYPWSLILACFRRFWCRERGILLWTVYPFSCDFIAKTIWFRSLFYVILHNAVSCNLQKWSNITVKFCIFVDSEGVEIPHSHQVASPIPFENMTTGTWKTNQTCIYYKQIDYF